MLHAQAATPSICTCLALRNVTVSRPAGAELYVETTNLDSLDPSVAMEEAIELCERFMGQTPPNGETALMSLRDQAARMIQSLAQDSFPKFVQSKQARTSPAPVQTQCLPSVWPTQCSPPRYPPLAVPAAGGAAAKE